MKNLELDFLGRVKLAEVLGNAVGPLGKIAVLQAVWAKVRLSEKEMEQVTQTDAGDGRIHVSAPLGSLMKQVSIEDSQARLVLAELEAWRGYQISDLEWFESLKAQLQAKTEVIKKKGA